MKYSWKDRLKNYAALQRLFAFLITVCVIYLFLPSEALFKYEYQLNQPWKHERLYAPFEFAIRKTSEQISKEEEYINKYEPIVFEYDEAKTLRMFDRVESRFDFPDSVEIICDLNSSIVYSEFKRILETGICNRGLAPEKFNGQAQLKVLKNGVLSQTSKSNIFTLNQALDVLKQTAKTDSCEIQMLHFLSRNLEPNLVYNDSLTTKLLRQKIQEILPLQGKVEKGQAIIDKGDLVTAEKHKILESLRSEYQERTMSYTGIQWTGLAEAGIATVLIGLLIVFVYLNQNRLFNDPRPITLSLSLVAISFVMSSLANNSEVLSMYAIPIGIVPLLLRMFYDFRVSIFTFIILTLILALISSNPLEFIIIQTSAISFATLYQASNTKRSRMLGTALLVFAGYSVIYLFVSLAQNGNWDGLESSYFGWFAINALLCTLVFQLVYLVEKIFGYVSETTLLELGDSNQPLLKELAVKAPGTFQHSLQVANLAEKIAAKIGGNSVLLRTSAMYHDIGKMHAPQFFIENQLPDNNPHDELEPEESADVIINHVTMGVEMARREGLPFDVIQFIRTHHGTSKVQYFLRQAQSKNGEELTNEGKFIYPGPRPKTKEQAILMMSDAVEAASRSLKKYDNESIENLVNGILDFQKSEGQFEEAPITFKDISEAKFALKNALKSIYHQRISYD